ncbi:MAG: LacI family DNA-binding transcriptional regulator [Actinomycetota bacterium]
MTIPPRKGRPRHATIYSVAAQAGVSIATVSRVLSSPDKVAERTRDRVMAAIDELNYVQHGAARSLAFRSHEAYGLVVPELSGPYYADILSGFESAAAERGAGVYVQLTRDKPRSDLAVRRLAGRVDAMAIMGGSCVAASTVTALSHKLPVIQFAGVEVDGIETYGIESRTSARTLTEHLLVDHGRRNLRFVGSPDGAPDVQRRYEGFVDAHIAHDLEAAPPVTARLCEEEGQVVARTFAAGDLSADGLLCANDELALSVMSGLKDAGIDVPGSVAVTGWDDQPAAKYVGLTTVRQSVRALGRLVAERLGEVLEDPSSPGRERWLPTRVVLRHSCGCA